MQDVRYAFRSLSRQPIFTLVAVLTLTLGIGANTAIFSVLHQVLLRPLPYPEADRLVFIWNTYPLMGLPKATVSIPDYLDRKAQATALSDAALVSFQAMSLAGGSQPEQILGLRVTPSFFSTLGRTPARGRGFVDAEAQPGADRLAILTHGLWVSSFGSDPAIVDRDIRLNGEPYRVVGVLGADFELPWREAGVLVPFAFTPEQMSDEGRGNEFSTMLGRLAPGATIEQLNSQMDVIVQRNLERLPQFRSFVESSGFTGFAIDMREELVGDVRTPLLVLQAGVLLVLLIACANVANLLLMRATGRYRELAIRTTLGAGRGRLARQLLTEALVLAVIGGLGGLLAGFAGLRLLIALGGEQLPWAVEAAIQPGVLAFTFGLALATGVVFGLAPALLVLRGHTASLLKDDSARSSAGKATGRARAVLVVAEVALALMLLVGAGLLIKSFSRLQQVDPGFASENVLTARISLPASRYPDAVARRAFWSRLLEGARAIPGVTAVGLTSNLPFSGNLSTGSYTIVGYTPGSGEAEPHANHQVVGGDYFRALQIPLVAGRAFTDSDTAEAPRVAIIDEYLVKRYFPDRDPIGQQIRRGGPDSPPITIVGVVRTINATDLGEPVTKERVYYPVAQMGPGAMTITLKTALNPGDLVPQLRAAVQAMDPEQPLAQVRTLDQWLARSLQGRRTPMMLLALFGVVALVLSAIGIYGVLAFSVAQRVREFGIRQALGARPGAILSLVLGQGLRTVGLGLLLGLGGAIALTRYLQSLLFGIGAHDLAVFATVTTVLFVVAALACYVPARRATRIDPMVALREI
jgi:putative ABC transport system permease protein